MITLSMDFNKADAISNEITSSTQDISNISDSAKGISADAFASYSSSTVALTEEFKSSVSKLVTSCDNFLSKFKASVQTYRDAYEEEQRRVAELKNSSNNITTISKDETPKTEPVATVATTGTVTFKVDETKASEINETIKFYFNYQGNVSEVHEMSSNDMAKLFEKNGALKAINGKYSNGHSTTRTGDGWYMFTKDGHTYEYNVNTNEIIVDYHSPNSIEPNSKFNCKMFTTGDTNYDSITNTITILGGQGILEVKDPRYDKDSSRTLMSGVNANKNSLVIVPYGRGYGTVGANIAPGAISATTIGNFMVGGSTKKVTNSIVGFSLGGQATYQALASSSGLYQKAVIVNSGMQKLKTGSISNMKDVEIIIMQANNDQTFGTWAPETLKKLVSQGVPKDNITVYTNSGGMLTAANSCLDSSHVHNVTSEVKGTRTWSKHNYGIDMIKTSGVLGYLSS